MVIVLESTTYPGTTREMVQTRLEEVSGMKTGKDFFLAFSPERVDPGRKDFTTINTPKVIGGITADCGEVATAWYRQAIQTVVPVSSAEVAEMAKLLENTFRMINIGLVNELSLMCDRLGVDVWEVIDAAATKPFGFMKFTPGPGLGGHCIPIRPALSFLEAENPQLHCPIHRAGFRDQHRYAALCGQPHSGRAEHPVESAKGQPGARAWGCLQARY